MKKVRCFLYILVFVFFSCFTKSDAKLNKLNNPTIQTNSFENTSKVIHVFVALCDNQYQGIVPVSKKIGNGQDPDNNLYWGCGFGIRTYFKKSKEWKFIKLEKISNTILERIYFKHVTKDCYLIADAYNGKEIELCTKDFLKSNSGEFKETIEINGKTIGINGNSNLVAYIGHNGLMDFQLTESYKNRDNKTRDCIILACKSKNYFTTYIKNAKSNPLVWTTQFMAPEAYTIHDALSGYLANENANRIHIRASKAYSKYQKCSLKAASKLLTSGF